MEFVVLLWNTVIIQPMINGLILLYLFLFRDFGLSIIAFTLLIRVVTFPITMRQMKQMKAMQVLQPKLQEIQKRHAKERQKISQETFRLYKEHGVNPIGCLGPMVIQMPVWIGLYQALIQALGTTPESLLGLSKHLYPWLGQVHAAIPVNSGFLWLNLGTPDPTPVLPVLVGATMWITQKMSTMPNADPKQASTQNMMLWMMPLMFGFFTFQFPSGLAVYWVVSNAIQIGIQYLATGWGGLKLTRKPATTLAAVPEPVKEVAADGQPGDLREDTGGGDRGSVKRARRRSRRGRNRSSL